MIVLQNMIPLNYHDITEDTVKYKVPAIKIFMLLTIPLACLSFRGKIQQTW